MVNLRSRLEEYAAELQKSTLDFQKATLELQKTTSKQFAEIMAVLNRSRNDKLCDDRSTLDRYSPSSQQVKGSGSEGLERSRDDRRTEESLEDQICDEEELAEIEAETKSSGIEDRAVENEANSNVISAIGKEESTPQFLMVTEADSTCVQHTNVILQQVSISPLEHSLNFCKANLDVKGNCQYAMGKTHQIWSDSNFGCVNDDACQMFDVIPMRTQVLPKEHKERFHKFWRFKFKHRVAPRDFKSVSDVLRTTSGPNSMLKMLLDAGGIVVTDDGNAILREIEVAHPAAKSMIELRRTQDEEVGDGTTSVIVLAGEWLHVDESFIEKSYHPTVICQAYNKALEGAIAAVLDKIAMPIDVKDHATVLGLVKSCIRTKFTSKFGDLIADLAIDATTTISVDLGQGLREVE